MSNYPQAMLTVADHAGNDAKYRWLRALQRTGGALTLLLGLAALVGWGAGVPWLTTLAAGRMPMAPSTALLFVASGGLLLSGRAAPKTRARGRQALIAALIGATALLLAIAASVGIMSPVEHLGLDIQGSLAGAPVGHISPVTALGFVVGSLAYLLATTRGRPGPRAVHVALALSVGLVLLSFVLTTAYLLGTPLLYNSGIIPPALTTSLGFLSLGVALMAWSARGLGTAHSGSAPATPPPPYALLLVLSLIHI